jgi:hypothetical protein
MAARIANVLSGLLYSSETKYALPVSIIDIILSPLEAPRVCASFYGGVLSNLAENSHQIQALQVREAGLRRLFESEKEPF